MSFAPSALQRWRLLSQPIAPQAVRVLKAAPRRFPPSASNGVEREGSTERTKILGPDRPQDSATVVPTVQQSTLHDAGWWGALESRYKIVIACTLSFVVCNMVSAMMIYQLSCAGMFALSCPLVMQDKVNMSVAIIPMAEDFGWSPSVSGIVQSAFFYGCVRMTSLM